MAKIQKKYEPEEKQRLLDGFAASGIDARAYCAREGVPYGTFMSWRSPKRAAKPRRVSRKTGPVDPKARILAVEAFRFVSYC